MRGGAQRGRRGPSEGEAHGQAAEDVQLLVALHQTQGWHLQVPRDIRGPVQLHDDAGPGEPLQVQQEGQCRGHGGENLRAAPQRQEASCPH